MGCLDLVLVRCVALAYIVEVKPGAIPAENKSVVHQAKAKEGQDTVDDPERLELLQASDLLDTPPEEAFDRFTRLASQMLHAPIALISLVDADRQFFKSQHGLSEPLATKRQTPLTHSFCKHLVGTSGPLIIDDARLHPLVRNNPMIREHQVIAYLGVPLQTTQGQTLGSLCTIDNKPRQWSKNEIATLEDLGSWVMTEVQLRLLARHYLSSYMRTRDLELQRDELSQMLVHDLRNPLSSLISALELVQADGGLAQPGQHYVELAQQSAESLLAMIGDILDVSKAEAGRLSLDLAAVCPAALIKTACAQTEAMAQSAGVTLLQDVDADLPELTADREKLRRVLVNLISNAIQHTPRPGTVRIAARRSQDLHALTLQVSDTGVGMPAGAFEQIFEKFGGANGRRSCARVSTGLGLPFCKKAIEAHGGKIVVSSELGQGTVFRIELPYSS